MNPLVVNHLSFYPTQNAKDHNTSKYEIVMGTENPTTAIVRRGQPFSGVLLFDRPLEEAADVVQLVFRLGDQEYNKDTMGTMVLSRDAVLDDKSWGCKLVEVLEGNTVTFQVSSPASAAVGNWSVLVVTKTKSSNVQENFEFNEDLYILFNPWIAGDQTYMQDTVLLQEYVLNDIGKIWKGSSKQMRGQPWIFGQFDARILPACLFVLDRADTPYQERGDPVKLTRAISRIVNSNDDDGVMVGRWDNEYDDGTAPTDWTNSIDILEQYLNDEGVPVKYGQCWVFAGVTATVCRALGVPCRVVTNIGSAHDSDGTLTVNIYYNKNMEEITQDPDLPSHDSIWNYHVWNDVWMARPDLPPGYGGWQAIDGTPQELSEGVYQCGPAPLEAIKQGKMGLNYDVEFMLASVNADVIRWKVDPKAERGYSVVNVNKNQIGRMIMTKKLYVFDPLGDEDREDIVGQYKYQENTNAERVAYMNAVQNTQNAKNYYAEIGAMSTDVEFKLRDTATVLIGKEFQIAVDVENTSDKDRTVKVHLWANSVYYNGMRSNHPPLTDKFGDIKLGPKKTESLSVVIKAEDYLKKLAEGCHIKISAMTTVVETEQTWADDQNYQLIIPDIVVKVNQDLIVNESAVVLLSFRNPLHVDLTGCKIQVSSSNIAQTLKIETHDVPANEQFSIEVPVRPKKIGQAMIIAKFTSKELITSLEGRLSVEVFEG